ncbi:MAG: photosystem II cytochrome PsbV2 [Gemmatimonadaceae bacterium]|nr:photosystem II cytochrome PsbV2 [Gloeobacterales cyanobacterium ES-bin-141]
MTLMRRCLPLIILTGLFLSSCSGGSSQTSAAAKDKYLTVNMQVRGPVELAVDGQGNLETFTPDDLLMGKQLFESNCKNCHVGGVTTPNPKVSLALAKLQGATPPRDNVAALVQFMRQPLSYDGKEEVYSCRKTDWLKDKEAQNLSAFILRASQKATGWGTAQMERNQDSFEPVQ